MSSMVGIDEQIRTVLMHVITSIFAILNTKNLHKTPDFYATSLGDLKRAHYEASFLGGLKTSLSMKNCLK